MGLFAYMSFVSDSLRVLNLSVTTTTSATGSTTSEAVRGLLYGVDMDIDALDATADTTLAYTNDFTGETVNLLVITNSQTNAQYQPRADEHDGTGTALTSDTLPFVNGRVTLSVAQGGASNEAKVSLLLMV